VELVTAAHLRPRRRPRASRGPARFRGTAVLALLVVAGVLAGAAASASFSKPGPTPLERQLQDEIDAMITSGLSRHDPKVEMLRDQLAELQSGDTARPPREKGVDTGKVLAGDETQAARQDSAARDGASPLTAEAAPPASAPSPAGSEAAKSDWQSGKVECEVVPGLLGPAEIAGATCASVPQPDGTSRYVAVGRDGVVRSVLFGADGHIRRLPDTRLATPAPAGTGMAPTAKGDLRVTPPGGAPTVVDLR
jgi:hypothetical protein